MNVMTVIAHPNPKSFCHAILRRFDAGLKEAGHTNDIVDLYAMKFDPVFRTRDYASYIDESVPPDMPGEWNLMGSIMEFCGGPVQRFVASAGWARRRRSSSSGSSASRCPATSWTSSGGCSGRKAWPSSPRITG